MSSGQTAEPNRQLGIRCNRRRRAGVVSALSGASRTVNRLVHCALCIVHIYPWWTFYKTYLTFEGRGKYCICIFSIY